jgi:CheY-like chemotaxis protein
MVAPGDVRALADAFAAWNADAGLLDRAKRGAWAAAVRRWHWEHADDRGRLLLAVLESYGYRVLIAASGAEALEIAARERESIHLLITDVVMPGMNGRELAERLQADLPGLRVLFTSGYPADQTIRRGIAEGRVSFIQKPYHPDELARIVRRILAPA